MPCDDDIEEGKESGRIGGFLKRASSKAGTLAGKAKDTVNKGKTNIINVIDANGNGQLDIEEIIILGLRTPGIGINRESFLRAELKKSFSADVIDDAVEFTPAHAGIPVEAIDKLSDNVIAFERTCVSGISAALGMPGGAAMAATIPADIVQYYAYMLRAAQKLLYLYGFPQIDVKDKGTTFDSETLNMLTLCLGVMYGVAGANKALIVMSHALAAGVEKKLLRTALTKGTIYPIVKKTAALFGQKMTKAIFAGFFKKAIPVAGGIIGGSMTFLSFKPCCVKLRNTLNNTILSNPQGFEAADGEMAAGEILDTIDIDDSEESEEFALTVEDEEDPEVR